MYPSFFTPFFLRRFRLVRQLGLSFCGAVLAFGLLLLVLRPNAWAQSEPAVSRNNFSTHQLATAPDTTETTGSISGRITNRVDDTLAEIQVILYRDRSRIATTQSDANGQYHFTLLGAGIYQVGFIDQRERYGAEYYPNQRALQFAQDVIVAGAPQTGIDAVLELPGMIAGTISTTAGTSIQSITFRLSRKYESPDDISLQATTLPLTSPVATLSYSLTAPAETQLVICVSATIKEQNDITECYDNTDYNNSTPITVTSGGVHTGIDFVLGDGADLATIQGQVTNLERKPLSNIVVSSYFDAEFYGLLYNKSVKTDASGVYTLTYLVPSTYQLIFDDPDGLYVSQFYTNGTTAITNTNITVTLHERRTGINTSLIRGGTIRGRVAFQDQPLQGTLKIYRNSQFFPTEWYPIQSINLETDGSYRSLALPTGIYRACAVLSSTVDEHVIEQTSSFGCYPNGNQVSTARDLSVKAGEVLSDINISLVYTRYDGELTGLVLAEGNPVGSIKVELFASSYSVFYIYKPLVYTFTNAMGEYKLGGLPKDSYYLGFSDPNGNYVSTLYTGTQFLLEAQSFPISVSQPLTTQNISLARGAGSIEGHVLNRDGDAFADSSFTLYRYRNQWEEIYIPQIRTALTGYYRISGLAPGIYRLRNDWDGRFYGNVDSVNFAKDITVMAGSTTTDIDIAYNLPLTPPEAILTNHLFLPVVARAK